jgi:hypothetical protein
MRLLKVGSTVQPVSMDEFVTVLACWLLRPSDVDAYAVWVVLCHLPHNTLHPFAVWTAYDRPEGWSFGSGSYHKTITGAVEQYETQGGKHDL